MSLQILQSRLEYIASNFVTLTPDQLKKAEKLIQTLKNHNDVTEVYDNIANITELPELQFNIIKNYILHEKLNMILQKLLINKKKYSDVLHLNNENYE